MNDQSAKLVNGGNTERLPKRCQSCDQVLENWKLKYCSAECKKRLKYVLRTSEGLLSSLNTRFASFSWNPSRLMLHVLPFGGAFVYCFFFDRTGFTKPADDIGKMVEELGTYWWDAREATGSRSRATQNVFTHAEATVQPQKFAALGKRKSPLQISKVAHSSIERLQLTHDDLLAADCEKRIKTAFRRKAKSTHPDHGGTADEFRKIKAASDMLMELARKPKTKVKKTTSLPNCWVYHGGRYINKWSPPSA